MHLSVETKTAGVEALKVGTLETPEALRVVTIAPPTRTTLHAPRGRAQLLKTMNHTYWIGPALFCVFISFTLL